MIIIEVEKNAGSAIAIITGCGLIAFIASLAAVVTIIHAC